MDGPAVLCSIRFDGVPAKAPPNVRRSCLPTPRRRCSLWNEDAVEQAGEAAMKKARGSTLINIGNIKSRYVVMKSLTDMTVVSHGNDLSAVLSKADKAGVIEPFVVFPHDPAKRYIY